MCIQICDGLHMYCVSNKTIYQNGLFLLSLNCSYSKTILIYIDVLFVYLVAVVVAKKKKNSVHLSISTHSLFSLHHTIFVFDLCLIKTLFICLYHNKILIYILDITIT